MPLAQSQVLNNRYRIVKLLGQGGMGAVYRAWDTNVNARCAIKENLDTSANAAQQFAREATLLANLRHPNLPRVSDHFTVPGQGQYLVMDYIEGDDLETMLAQAGGPLPEAPVLGWIAQICDALVYLHTRNPTIIHRDLKPANIKITSQGQAVLVDFGIAKVYDPNTPTLTGARAASPPYSPLEQYGRGGRTDARTDVYALGATLYALLTGQEPVESPERAQGIALPAPRALNPVISLYVERAVVQAMEMQPDRRYQTVAELKAGLSAPIPAPPPAPRLAVSPPIAPVAAPASVPTRSGPGAAIWMLAAASMVVFGLVLVGWLVFSNLKAAPTSTATVPSNMPRPTDTLMASTPTLGIGSTMISGKDGMTLLYVPEGEFPMGLTEAEVAQLMKDTPCDVCFASSKPQHKVYLDAFWIDKTEVTNAMFAKFVAETGYQTDGEKAGEGPALVFPDHWGFITGANWQHPRGPTSDVNSLGDHPVVQMTWNDATTYCAWAGRRLPTEAEWEKAARGIDARKYPWGNNPVAGNLLDYADKNLPVNWADKGVDDGYEFTAPVSHYLAGASPYGVLDMAGNVWEWVNDWYSGNYYATSSISNPTGPASGSDRVLRGGAWDLPAQYAIAASRYWSPQANWNFWFGSFGFRCAR